MGESAKSLRLERIKPDSAKQYLDRHHPLGAGGSFSVAIGVFWAGRLSGVLTLGNPVVNNAGRVIGLQQHELLELKKMHLSDACPRNSESRALAIVAKLVRKHYPDLKAMITYCGSEEKAVAYKASGWIQGKTQRYVRDVKISGKWLTVRNANRMGITKQATEVRHESRCKWILPLNETVAALAQR